MTSHAPAPLAGLRVLCVDNYLAGNYGPMLLALHGADVIKVESAAGEAMRRSRPFLPDAGGEWSHFELRMMRGKGSISLDLDGDGDERAAFENLVRAADVFWTNLRPESAERRRIDAARLRAINPALVYVSITGFGLPENGAGEFSAQPAFDILVQGTAGLLDRNRDEAGVPTYNGLPIADQVTSIFGAFGALLGIQRRARTGEGCVVDVPMLDSMVALNEKAISMFGMQHEVPPPRMSATASPFGLYRALDGWVCLAVGSDEVWRRFAEVIGDEVGRPGLADDPGLRAGTARVARTDEVTMLVEAYTTVRPAAEVVERMNARGVPAGVPLEVDALLNTDQMRARGVVRTLRLESGVEVPAVMSPVAITGVQQEVALPPRRDADRERVLREWLGE